MKIFNSDELRRRVDEVLYYVWDHIGVSSEPCARGEYENYVSTVLQLVEQNNVPEPISLYLSQVITDKMELSSNKKACDDVADLLLEHKRAIKEGLS